MWNGKGTSLLALRVRDGRVAAACAVLSLGLAGEPCFGSDVFVSPGGSDQWAGSADRPFASLERARDAVRNLRGHEPITVWIAAGSYELTRTFALTQADSGTAAAPVVYRALPGAEVRVSGGREIKSWSPVADAVVLARLDAAAYGRVVQADLRALGIVDFGKMTSRGFGRPVAASGLEVFCNDRPMPLARWPNRGWAYTTGAPAGADGGVFSYQGDRPRRWASVPDLWVHGYWTQDWADSYERVVSVDPDRQYISTAPPHGVYGYAAGKRWRALNALEELDEPGEWYLDRTAGILYFWPPEPVDKLRVTVSLLNTALISLQNVSYVTFRDVILEATRAAAVEISGGAGVLVMGCTIRNVGTRGVNIGGGTGHGVAGCNIASTGDGAILLSGGDRGKLIPSGHYAASNHIRDFSRWSRTYRPAVQFSGVGASAVNNLIHHGSHDAIQLSGNDHLIQLNDIHTVAMETADVGAFYMGRDFTMRGNAIKNNFFHNVGDGDVNSVYLDDCASGTSVYGNLFHRAGRSTFIGGGRDNTVENNLYVDGNPAVEVDARGTTWAKKWFNGEDPAIMNGLKAVPYQSPPWSERYPSLVSVLDDEPAVPKGNRVVRNISSGGRWTVLRDGTDRLVFTESNVVAADPGFVNRAKNDFRLAPGAPVYREIRFDPIPVESIGLPQLESEVVHAAVTNPSAGRLRLTVENLGRVGASGSYTLWVYPDEAARLSPGRTVAFALEAGESSVFEFQLQLGSGVRQITVGVERDGEDLHPMGITAR
jgi:hypothetical protein